MRNLHQLTKCVLWGFFSGFCKHDSNHDVFLLVEAYEQPTGGDQSRGRRVGEAKFAIYPRTNAPKVNVKAPAGKDMYRASNVMTLLRTLSTENIKMHCGRLQYVAALREVPTDPPKGKDKTAPVKPPEPTPREPTPKPASPVPQQASPSPESSRPSPRKDASSSPRKSQPEPSASPVERSADTVS